MFGVRADHKGWMDAELRYLLSERSKGVPFTKIAKQLGRSRNSVWGKWRRESANKQSE